MSTGQTKLYEKAIVRRAEIGLFHGMDCYTAYHSICRAPYLVHDVHVGDSERVSEGELAARLGSQKHGPLRICYIGRVHREKGVYDWIDALHRAKLEGADYRAIWIGDGPEISSARRYVSERRLTGIVEFIGQATDRQSMLMTLKTQDIFLFCHLTPESPRCLLESLICGVPLVGFRSPFSSDLISEHEGGILSPMRDVQSLSNIVVQLFRDRDHLMKITLRAALDGKLFDDEKVFAHRVMLMKKMRPWQYRS